MDDVSPFRLSLNDSCLTQWVFFTAPRPADPMRVWQREEKDRRKLLRRAEEERVELLNILTSIAEITLVMEHTR